MKNFVQAGMRIAITAAADITSGDGVLTGALFGVAFGDAASGEVVTIERVGVFELPKLGTDVIAVGDKVYWDDTEKHLTVTATGNTLVGCAVQAAAASTTTAIVLLPGLIT